MSKLRPSIVGPICNVCDCNPCGCRGANGDRTRLQQREIAKSIAASRYFAGLTTTKPEGF